MGPASGGNMERHESRKWPHQGHAYRMRDGQSCQRCWHSGGAHAIISDNTTVLTRRTRTSQTGTSLMNPHVFAGNPLDRGDTYRRDQAWLDAQAINSQSRFLPL